MHDSSSPSHPSVDTTTLRPGEDSIVETETRLRMLLEASPQPMWIYDAQTLAFLFVNDAAVYRYGYSRDQFLTMTILDIRPPEDALAVRAFVSQPLPLFNKHGAWRHQTHDGTVIVVEIFTHEVIWEGRAARSALINDITERTRLEEELRERETHYGKMFANHPAMQLLLDPATGAIVDANPAACSFYGYPRDVLLAMHAYELSGRPAAEVDAVMAQARIERPGVYVARARLASGAVREVEVRTGAIESNGRSLLFAIIHDVTERVQAEEMLHHEREFLGAVLEHLQDGVVACDADGVLTLFNRATRELHGTAEASLPSSAWAERYDLYRPDGETRMSEDEVPLFRALQGAVIRNEEMVIAPRGGPPHRVLASGQAIVDAQGRKLGAVVAMHEITERRQAEEQHRRQNAHLAALHELSLGILNRLDITAILDVSIRRIATLLGTTHGYIALVAENGAYLEKMVSLGAYDTGERAPLRAGSFGRPLRKGEGIAGTVWETGQPLTLDDYHAWPERLSSPGFIRAVVAVPLITDGKVLGVLGLAHVEAGRTFDPEAVTVLGRFAALVTVALENVRLYQAAQEEIAERQKVERSLTAAQQIAHLGSWELDIATGTCRWSDELFRLVGLAPGTIVPNRDSFLAVVHPDDRLDVEAQLRRMRTGERLTGTFRIIRPDGTIRILEAQGEVERDASGRPERVIGTALDITEREQAHVELREREVNFAAAQRLTHLGSWEWNIASGALSWSDEMFRVLGLTPGEIQPTFERFLTIVHPDDRDATAAAIQAALAGDAFAAEMRVVVPDGIVRTVAAQGAVEYDASGQPLRMRGTGQDITERKRAEEQLYRYAYYDALTGLPNRLSFTNRLAAAAQRLRTDPTQGFAVLFLDLDRFKTVNDSLGHERGDRLLARVAARLQESAPPGALVTRFGGDEFAILLEGISDKREATAVASQIHAALDAPFRLGGFDLRVTASIGITMGSASQNGTMLLRDADIAMYRAKAHGRGQSIIFDPGMRIAVIRRMMIEADLQHGLEREEFRLVYQPIIALGTGAIIGFEALLRWDHPRMGALSPAEFIPIVEDTGFIVPLGEWVLRAACQQLRTWQAQHPALGTVTMSVNLSGLQISHPGLVERVAQILRESGVSPAGLRLEITERVLVTYTEAAFETLTRLHELGVQIALDDFGVEYSSLNYLRRFPIDVIKIDQSFIGACVENEDDGKVVRAMVGLAHSLGIAVTAEGIESDEQRQLLRELACEHGQGNYFARPLGADEALTFMQNAAAHS